MTGIETVVKRLGGLKTVFEQMSLEDEEEPEWVSVQGMLFKTGGPV